MTTKTNGALLSIVEMQIRTDRPVDNWGSDSKESLGHNSITVEQWERSQHHEWYKAGLLIKDNIYRKKFVVQLAVRPSYWRGKQYGTGVMANSARLNNTQ